MFQSVRGKLVFTLSMVGLVPIIFFGLAVLYIFMDNSFASALSQSPHVMYISLITLAAAFVGVLIICTYIARRIASHLKHITFYIQSVANEDQLDIPYLNRDDEFYDIGQCLLTLRSKIDKSNSAISLYNEHHDIEEASLQELEGIHKKSRKFHDEIDILSEQLFNIMTELESVTKIVSGKYQENVEKTNSISHAANVTQDNVSQIATAMSEFSTSIQEISHQVANSTKIASDAVEESQKANHAIESLAKAAIKIEGVAKVINEITEKINLLSLNATIEASRAGEAGKGFAVVASEVKALANQTANATKEISEQIDAIQTESQQAVLVMKDIGKIIRTMDEFSNAIAAAVDQQGATSKEIARNIHQAAESSNLVSKALDDTNQLVQDSDQKTKRLIRLVIDLQNRFDSLKQQLDKFLKEII